jgi:hypothetical protein
VVTVKSPEETGRDYAETSIRIKPNPSPVSSNPDIVEKIKQHPNITELYPEPSYDELKTYLQTYLGQSDDTEDLNYTRNSKSEQKTETTPKSTPDKTDSGDVDAVFDDLF